jgi:uncharacterized membrane protein YoaK (UPF0700 family)
MIYGNESISQYTRSNVAIWMAMALQAGVFNVGGFLACQRFVSHVTGFATYFGVEVAQPEGRHAAGMLAVPLFFIFGAMLSGVLVDLRIKQHKLPRYYVAFGIIFGLSLIVLVGGVLGYWGKFGHILESRRDYTLLILLCLICGIQNGTITTVSRSVVRTTHLTGITTDLGIGLVRFLNRNKIPADTIPNEGKANLMRIGIVSFFILGSVIGAFLFKRFEYGGFALPVVTSGLLFAAMIYYQVRRAPVNA